MACARSVRAARCFDMFSILLKEGSGINPERFVVIRSAPGWSKLHCQLSPSGWLFGARGVADGCSAVLIDVAQGFGGEVGECGVAVDGHDEVGFREDGAQDVDDAVNAAECEAVGLGAPLPSLIMPPSAQARPP